MDSFDVVAGGGVPSVAPNRRGRSGGDAESAFDEWVRPHVRGMQRLAMRLGAVDDADDVVQEALSRAWLKWDQFDPARGTPSAWLLAITADCAARSRRWLSRRRWVDLSTSPQVGVEPGVPGIDAELDEAVRALPRRQRLAVELRYFLDLSTRETALVMGCSEGTVKSTLHDARGALKSILESDHGR